MRRRRGFTLVEVLVAVIILLIGVVAALRIFPPGFRMFQESNDTSRAVSIMQGQIAEFQNHPESLPDAILPVDYSSPESMDWVKNKFDFNDMQPIDYLGGNTWLTRLKMPVAGDSTWPLWEPVSVRAMRRIVGERVVIPADLTSKKHVAWVSGQAGAALTVDDTTGIAVGMTLFLSDAASGGTAAQFVHVQSVDSPTQMTIAETISFAVLAELSTTVGGSPCYLPRFGPISPNMQWDTTTSTFIADPNPVTVYDIRYRNITLEQLQALAAQGGTGNDDFYYAVNYTDGTVYFLQPKVATTSIRFTFSLLDTTINNQVQVAGETRTLPDITTDAPGNQLLFPGLIYPIRTGSDATGQLYALQFPYGWKIIPGSEQFNRSYTYVKDVDPSALITGQYTVEPGSDQTLDVLHFAPADIGRTVKLDYTCTDWNILHEDVAVDPQGYLNLMARNLKVGYLFNFPREPLPWGLTQTLQGDPLTDEVVRLVNLRTGASYMVTTDAATDPTPQYPKYFLQAKQGATGNGPTVVDMSLTDGGRIRIGTGQPSNPSWMNYNTVNSTEFSPFAGDTYRVFYRTRQDWTLQTFRAPAQFWYTSDPVNLGWDRYNLVGKEIKLPGVYEGQTIAVDYQYQQGIALGRVSGEQHLIPLRDKASGLSTVTLNNLPNGAINVRGVSVTVRAMWIQPRNTTARRYSIAEPDGIDRTINERWQSKSITVVLPATKE